MTDADFIELAARTIAREVVTALEPLIAASLRRLHAERVQVQQGPVSARVRACSICGKPGHYASSPRHHTDAERQARSDREWSKVVARSERAVAAVDQAAVHATEAAAELRAIAPPAPRHLRPTAAALAAAEARAVAREAHPVNPRGQLPTPISTWVF